LWVDEAQKQLVFRRGPLVFVFNFHQSHSHNDWRIPIHDAADYRVVLNTDNTAYDGPGLCEVEQTYSKQTVPVAGRGQSVQIYVPARSAQVLAPV